ncbi:MFS transporter [Kitasatospora purpeofusca]|uniref:MFS transporter n=1 Tax=Kitasatospora purpeofusca TaxID=67352 RepID=A0ABZ1U7X4_9ACTN|nr:MFS transporter [Kitasatospora purpeofusca]
MSGSTTEPRRVFGPYLRLLRAPGAAPLAFWGTVGRLPIAMRPLGCLLAVSASTGSLGDAGTVAAAMLVAQGLASPVLGRLADRVSQRRVLLTACVAHATGMALLVAAILLDAPLWLLALAAVAPGCTSVSFTSFMRARWAVMVDQGSLRTAYAMESVLDDTIFLVGPLLATALAAVLHPAAGLITCAVFTTTGSVFVALHRRSEPVSAATAGEPRRWAITVPGVWVMMIVYGGMGFQFGAVDVMLVAFGQEHSSNGLGGVLLALEAVGSLVAGATFGAMEWRLPQRRLLPLTAGVLTLSAIPLALTDSPYLMAVFAVLAGVAISPALITGSTVLESVAPKGSLSEAFSWLTSMGALGIASGTAVGGYLSDTGSSAQAAQVSAVGGLVALVLSALAQSALRGRPAAEPLPA